MYGVPYICICICSSNHEPFPFRNCTYRSPSFQKCIDKFPCSRTCTHRSIDNYLFARSWSQNPSDLICKIEKFYVKTLLVIWFATDQIWAEKRDNRGENSGERRWNALCLQNCHDALSLLYGLPNSIVTQIEWTSKKHHFRKHYSNQQFRVIPYVLVDQVSPSNTQMSERPHWWSISTQSPFYTYIYTYVYYFFDNRNWGSCTTFILFKLIFINNVLQSNEWYWFPYLCRKRWNIYYRFTQSIWVEDFRIRLKPNFTVKSRGNISPVLAMSWLCSPFLQMPELDWLTLILVLPNLKSSIMHLYIPRLTTKWLIASLQK